MWSSGLVCISRDCDRKRTLISLPLIFFSDGKPFSQSVHQNSIICLWTVLLLPLFWTCSKIGTRCGHQQQRERKKKEETVRGTEIKKEWILMNRKTFSTMWGSIHYLFCETECWSLWFTSRFLLCFFFKFKTEQIS